MNSDVKTIQVDHQLSRPYSNKADARKEINRSQRHALGAKFIESLIPGVHYTTWYRKEIIDPRDYPNYYHPKWRYADSEFHHMQISFVEQEDVSRIIRGLKEEIKILKEDLAKARRRKKR